MRAKANMQNKFMLYMEKPIKLLHKARDFYVKSMEDCANMISYGSMVAGAPTAHVSRLPRSFSVNCSKSGNEETFREVLKGLLKMKMKNEKDLNYVKEKELREEKMEKRAMKRSCTSVGLGTIDEDKPCYFEDDVINARSTSFAFIRNFEY